MKIGITIAFFLSTFNTFSKIFIGITGISIQIHCRNKTVTTTRYCLLVARHAIPGSLHIISVSPQNSSMRWPLPSSLFDRGNGAGFRPEQPNSRPLTYKHRASPPHAHVWQIILFIFPFLTKMESNYYFSFSICDLLWWLWFTVFLVSPPWDTWFHRHPMFSESPDSKIIRKASGCKGSG